MMKAIQNLILCIIIFLPSISIISAEIPIEEIVITERKPLSLIRNQLLNAEGKMNGLFNALIGESEFNIICDKVTRTGSHFDKRECEPVFVIEARRGDFRQGMSATGNPFEAMNHVRSDRTLNNHLSEKRQQMEDLIVDLAMENPELFNTIMQIKELKQELEEAKNNRFGN